MEIEKYENVTEEKALFGLFSKTNNGYNNLSVDATESLRNLVQSDVQSDGLTGNLSIKKEENAEVNNCNIANQPACIQQSPVKEEIKTNIQKMSLDNSLTNGYVNETPHSDLSVGHACDKPSNAADTQIPEYYTTYSTSNRKRHMIHEKEVFTCDLCNLKTSFKGNLIRHVKRHVLIMKRNQIVCQYCGKGFKDKTEWREHERTHTGIKLYLCVVCNVRRSSKKSLVRHILSHLGLRLYVHTTMTKTLNGIPMKSANKLRNIFPNTGMKQFNCEVCGKSYHQSKELTVHKRLHTGERPYTCTVCGKSFNEKRCLNFHIKFGEHSSGERALQCTECSNTFKVRHHLISHMRNKHIFTKAIVFNQKALNKCEKCNKCYFINSGLCPHQCLQDVAASQSDFLCFKCDKIFKYKRSLARHTRCTHMTKKFFLCLHCNRALASKRDLTTHIKNHLFSRK